MNIKKALKKVSKNIQNKLSLNPQVDHDPPHSVVHDHPRHFLEHAPPINEARSSVVPPARHIDEASSSDVPPQNDGDCLFKPVVFSLRSLKFYTDNFSDENILGRGGTTTVYRGSRESFSGIFAVKRMQKGETGSEFQSELEALRVVCHRNILSLVGYCSEEGEKFLVYEYMPKGTLSRHLFDWEDEGLQSLSWDARMLIAFDIAKGLDYLHGSLNGAIVHRDLKPSNILLTDDMRAKIAYFGLGYFIPNDKSFIQTGIAKGTFGYIAPEYAASGTVGPPGDVYSFGVMLMELITGKQAVDDSRGEERQNIVQWFRKIRKNKNLLKSVIDDTIDTTEKNTLATIDRIRDLAYQCTEWKVKRRPDMSQVVSELYLLVEKRMPSPDEWEAEYHQQGENQYELPEEHHQAAATRYERGAEYHQQGEFRYEWPGEHHQAAATRYERDAEYHQQGEIQHELQEEHHQAAAAQY